MKCEMKELLEEGNRIVDISSIDDIEIPPYLSRFIIEPYEPVLTLKVSKADQIKIVTNKHKMGIYSSFEPLSKTNIEKKYIIVVVSKTGGPTRYIHLYKNRDATYTLDELGKEAVTWE